MPIDNILFSIGILLLFAKIFGEIVERFGITSLVGELIAGIIVGPVLSLVTVGEFLQNFLTLSVIFLLFVAGLEVKFDEIRKHTYMASVMAVMGGLASFLFGFAVGMIFLNNFIAAFAIGVVLISTSNGALFLILSKTGEFDSKIGKIIIATTIADDIVGIVFLSFFAVFIKSQVFDLDNAFKLFLVSIGLYFVMFTFGSRLMNKVIDLISRFRDENILFTIPVIFALILSYITDNLNLSIAAGAFLTGMAIANSKYSDTVIGPKIAVASHGFFLPLFYAAIGATLVLVNLDVVFILMILVAAILGKVIGIGLTSRFFGIKGDHSRLIGLIMIPRGNENIAIVEIVLLMGVITLHVYTSLLFAMVATVIVTPILVKLFYKKN